MTEDQYEEIWRHLDQPGERDGLMATAQEGPTLTPAQFARLTDLGLPFGGAVEAHEAAEGSGPEGYFMPDSFRVFLLHKAAAGWP